MHKHVAQYIDTYMDAIWRGFDVVASVLVAGVGIEFTADTVDCDSDTGWRRIAFPTLKKHMLEKVTYPICLFCLIDTSCFDDDFDGGRVGITHRCKDDIDAAD